MINEQIAGQLLGTLNTIRQQADPTPTEVGTAWVLSGLISVLLDKPPILPEPQPQKPQAAVAPPAQTAPAQAQPVQPQPPQAQVPQAMAPNSAQEQVAPTEQRQVTAAGKVKPFNLSKFNWREWFEQQEAAEKAANWYQLAKKS